MNFTKTFHWEEEREYRENFIRENIGFGQVLAEFIVDKGHKNGLEIHKVTSTAIIMVFNLRTGKWITSLIARPNQIRRLYEAEHKEAPKGLYEIALHHFEKGWHEI